MSVTGRDVILLFCKNTERLTIGIRQRKQEIEKIRYVDNAIHVSVFRSSAFVAKIVI